MGKDKALSAVNNEFLVIIKKTKQKGNKNNPRGKNITKKTK